MLDTSAFVETSVFAEASTGQDDGQDVGQAMLETSDSWLVARNPCPVIRGAEGGCFVNRAVD